MKIGSTIREIREFERNFKRNYVAQKLHITSRAYSNIENNIADVTLNRLEKIAEILQCSIDYILHHKERKLSYLNTFNNNGGNKGVIQINQSGHGYVCPEKERLLEELLQCERKRINLLEALLKTNNIDF